VKEKPNFTQKENKKEAVLKVLARHAELDSASLR
jgi:hypothetical protein